MTFNSPPPFDPIYQIVNNVRQAGEATSQAANAAADAIRRREEIARQIGAVAAQQTVHDPR